METNPKDPEVRADVYFVRLLPIKHTHATDGCYRSCGQERHRYDADGFVGLSIFELRFHAHILILDGLFVEFGIISIHQCINL
jgi:hypothetical protein